ncbi:MAG: amidohydrolase family protein [Bacteriovoracaceae bacterium]|nr:amidohydrolase family protein [Bacteriovoracaceae bacterium]
MNKQILFCISLIILSSCSAIVTPIGGSFDYEPEQMNKKMSAETKSFLDDIFKGIDNDCLEDFHVHAVGLGTHGTNNWVNPEMQSMAHPYKYLQYKVYMSASGIDDIDNADQQYMDRLTRLASVDPRYGKLHLFAFDHHYNVDGTINKDKSSFYIPNEYVFAMKDKYPDQIIPVISVHPERPDALTELEKWAKKGAKHIKWLPNAMRIDPSSEKLIPFYNMVKKYNMVILTHTGHEKAVEGEEFQKLANPLLLKRPLDMGVNVIMAHLASLGECTDFTDNNKEVFCFELFWKLFKEKKYEKNLFGEISGVTIHTRVGKAIDTLLAHPEYHHRIVNGSDYPLPAINILYRTGQFEDMGYITKKERKHLNEIYEYNPLLFDLALKRSLKHPKTGQKFKDSAFLTPKEIGTCKSSKN